MVLENKIKELKALKDKLSVSVSHAPEGALRISKNKRQLRYYIVTEKTRPNGISLSSKEVSKAKELAQGSYDRDVLKEVERELNILEPAYEHLKLNSIESIYNKLNPERKKLVTPVIVSDEEYAKAWQRKKYEQKKIGDDVPYYITDRGERVRSKSEILIANKLNAENIPYRYECKYTFKPEGYEVCPDFTVLNKRTRQTFIFEHFGMMDNPDYVENAISKIEDYIEHGWILGQKFVFTQETSRHPLNTRIVSKIIETYFK